MTEMNKKEHINPGKNKKKENFYQISASRLFFERKKCRHLMCLYIRRTLSDYKNNEMHSRNERRKKIHDKH